MLSEVINNDYLIFASDVKLLKELYDSSETINWFNLNVDDIYYSEDGSEYRVLVIDHTDQYVVLTLA